MKPSAFRKERYPHDRSVRVEISSDVDDLVAVKTGSNNSGRVAVEREALILSQIHHPNVVEYVSSARRGDEVVLVTQFAGRTTLAEFEPVNPSSVAAIGATLLTVIGELHAMGWAHSRLTEDHCIIDAHGGITLCAFGGAHRVRSRDPRVAADLAATVAIISTLSNRLARPADRKGRAAYRRLYDALARCTSSAQTRGNGSYAADALRIELGQIAGQRPIAGSISERTPGHEVLNPNEFDGDTITTPRILLPPDRARRRSAVPSGRPSRWASALRALLVICGLLGAIGALRWLGGPLSNPFTASSVTRLGDIPRPIVVALQLVRGAAFIAAVYALVLTATAFGAIVTRSSELERVAVKLTPPMARRFIIGLIGLGVLASATAQHSTDGQGFGSIATPSATTTAPSIESVLRSIRDEAPSHPDLVADSTASSTANSAAEAADAADAATPLPDMWVIERGDHLWKVAADTTARHLGRRPLTSEVRNYWQKVIDLNRESLVDRDNPDLVMVGQVIELPPYD